jgi:hypothetical protein
MPLTPRQRGSRAGRRLVREADRCPRSGPMSAKRTDVAEGDRCRRRRPLPRERANFRDFLLYFREFLLYFREFLRSFIKIPRIYYAIAFIHKKFLESREMDSRPFHARDRRARANLMNFTIFLENFYAQS